MKYIASNEAAMKTQAVAIKNLENQMGQLASAIDLKELFRVVSRKILVVAMNSVMPSHFREERS